MVLESDFADTGDAIMTPASHTKAGMATSALSNATISKRTGVDRQFTGVDQHAFSSFVPGTIRVEPEDDNEVPPPLFRRPGIVEEDSSDDEEETPDRILVEDVEDDDEEILEEAPPEGRGHRVQTPTDYY